MLELEYLYSKDILLLELGPREATKTNPNSGRNKLFNEFLQKMIKQVNLITPWRKKDDIIKTFWRNFLKKCLLFACVLFKDLI